MQGINEAVLPGLDDPNLERDGFQEVELYISGRKLLDKDIMSKSDPQAELYIDGKLIGKTENARNTLNPDFKTSFKVEYYFEKKQKVQISIKDIDKNGKFNNLGEVNTTLGHICGAKNQVALFDLTVDGKKAGQCIVKADILHQTRGSLNLSIGAKIQKGGCFCFGGYSSAQLILYRSTADDQPHSIPAFKSEVVKSVDNVDWKPFKVSVGRLFANDLEKSAFAAVMDGDKEIGRVKFTIKDLQGKDELMLTNKENGTKPGVLKLRKVDYQEQPSFLSYLRGGIQLNVMVAIDFTQSNRDPEDPKSRHAFKRFPDLNDYQKAILSVCDILLCYDHDKHVPVYGFGGKPPGAGQVQHVFPLNLDPQNPFVYQIDGIMNVYNQALTSIRQSGPTFFNQIINSANKVAEQCKNQGNQVYTILLILTDGMIHDMEKTKAELVRAAELPLSVIIVGVGDEKEEFENMIELDADKGSLMAGNKKSCRDITQFVEFEQFKGNKELLAAQVLAEVPKQFLEYMKMNGIKPNPPQQYDINQIAQNGQAIQMVEYNGQQQQQQQQQGINPQNVNINIQLNQ